MLWNGRGCVGVVEFIQGSQRALTYCVCCSVYVSPRVALCLEGVGVILYLTSALSLSGCGQWRNPGHDGERPDSQGPGGRAGLCPAGEPHQRGGFHWEPPQTLQGEPHLCKSQFYSLVKLKAQSFDLIAMCLSFSHRHTLAQCWCPWTPTKSWRSTLNSTWSDIGASISMKSHLTCKPSATSCYYSQFCSLLLCRLVQWDG